MSTNNCTLMSYRSHERIEGTCVHILPRAEVPRDLDIVPLPPGTFLHQNRAFFFIRHFFNVY